MEENGKRGNTTDAALEEEAEPGAARYRSALAALAVADLAGLGLRRVKLIQMENKRQYI
jgi:hypothetical protein